jgi:uncharacterized membrane protein
MSAGELTFNRRAVRPMQCLRDGWQLIKEEYWLFLGITFAGALLASAAPFGVLMGPMMCGIYLCLLRRSAGQRVSFDMLFKGFDYFVQSLIATLIMMVPVFVLSMLSVGVYLIGVFTVVGVNQSASPNPPPPDPTTLGIFAGVYVLVLMVAVLIALIAHIFLQFAYLLIVDRGLSGVAALKLSARAVWANFGGMVGLCLLFLLLNFVGMLLCYIGAIFETPLRFAMFAVAYRQMFPVEGSILSEPPPPTWPEVGGRFGTAEQTGIQPAPERPVSVTKTPDEPGVQQGEKLGNQE